LRPREADRVPALAGGKLKGDFAILAVEHRAQVCELPPSSTLVTATSFVDLSDSTSAGMP
jgi:hypothetical protein